jgi:hypothetical protein
MRWFKVRKSPVYPADHRWEVNKRKDGYESDVTALVRGMLQEDAIRDDQRAAWERWRNELTPLKNE